MSDDIPVSINEWWYSRQDYKKEYDPVLHGLHAGKDADGKIWMDKVSCGCFIKMLRLYILYSLLLRPDEKEETLGFSGIN